MVKKMEYMDYVNKAYEIALEFKNSSLYQEFLKVKNELFFKYEKKIVEFNKVKEKLASLNKYDLDYNKIVNEYFIYKDFFLNDELYKKYQKLELSINNELAKINEKIANTISKNMKYLNEFGFIEGENCG